MNTASLACLLQVAVPQKIGSVFHHLVRKVESFIGWPSVNEYILFGGLNLFPMYLFPGPSCQLLALSRWCCTWEDRGALSITLGMDAFPGVFAQVCGSAQLTSLQPALPHLPPSQPLFALCPWWFFFLSDHWDRSVGELGSRMYLLRAARKIFCAFCYPWRCISRILSSLFSAFYVFPTS